jgi:hypothetical protein
VTGIPIVDCATGTCVPCSCRRHSRRTFSSRTRCTSARADRRCRSLGSESFTHRHHYLLLPDSSISIKVSSDNLRPSLSVRDNAESSLLSTPFWGIVSSFVAVGVCTARVPIGTFDGFSPGFTSVVLPPGRIRKRLSKSEERTLSDTFDCVTPTSQSNLGLKPCGSENCKPNSPDCLANRQLILKSIAVRS